MDERIKPTRTINLRFGLFKASVRETQKDKREKLTEIKKSGGTVDSV